MNAVIDERSFDNIMKYIELAKASPECEIVHGGHGDKEKRYSLTDNNTHHKPEVQ